MGTTFLTDDEAETKHLEALDGAPARLRLFQMDLLDYDSVLATVCGCAGVFHVASPCTIEQVQDPQVLFRRAPGKFSIFLVFAWPHLGLNAEGASGPGDKGHLERANGGERSRGASRGGHVLHLRHCSEPQLAWWRSQEGELLDWYWILQAKGGKKVFSFLSFSASYSCVCVCV